jgi:hypothetical protein
LFALDESAPPQDKVCNAASLLNKLDSLSDRFEELTALLGLSPVISSGRSSALFKEYVEIRR